MATGRSGTARLQQFGVIFGYRQVVIYVEPHANETRLTTNTARTNLLINNEPLPWADWAAEFREKMPSEIEDPASCQSEPCGGKGVPDHGFSRKARYFFNIRRSSGAKTSGYARYIHHATRAENGNTMIS